MELTKKMTTEMGRLSQLDYKDSQKNKIVIVLDNIRSMHNVGAAFRISDAFMVEKIILCGISATPPRKEISKTALGAEEHVDWQYYADTLTAIQDLRKNNYIIVSVEQAHGSIILEEFIVDENKKYALVFGHEVDGVQEEIVKLSDFCCEIAQYGVKHSLNASVAMGIVCWKFTCKVSC